jgi:betaine reductase
MVIGSSDQNKQPVVTGVTYFLGHVPSLVRYGSKPSREIERDPSLLASTLGHLQTFEQAVAYPPNQVFIGNIEPEDLTQTTLSPWYQHPIPSASRWGAFGEIMPEEEFYGVMKICDEFGLLLLEEGFLNEVASRLRSHSLFSAEDSQRLGKGLAVQQIEAKLSEEETGCKAT